MGESAQKSSWSFRIWGVIAPLVIIGFVVWASLLQSACACGSPTNACINNLRQIDAAKQEWALENGKTNGAVCTIDDIKPYIKLDASGHIPQCPGEGIYTIGKIGEPPTCSLSTANPPHKLP